MKERVVEILILIMSEIHDSKRLKDVDLGELKRKGYTQSEISAAFSWLYDNFPVHDGVVSMASRPSLGSRRLLHEAEKLMLSTESQGYLVQLTELGLLDNKDLEVIIERVMMMGYEKLPVSELHEVVTGVLFAKKGTDGSSIGSMIHRSDTIN